VRVVVTGALGHIGSSLIRSAELVEAADEIILIDNLSTQRLPSLFNLPRQTKYTLKTDDLEVALVERVLDGVDAVIHLAAITEPSAAVNNPSALLNNNLRLTKHVANICSKASVPMVFVSSTSVYAGKESLVDETSLAENAQSPYAQCKLQEESHVLRLGREGMQTAIFRFGTIFGVSPGMRFHTAVNKFCWQAALGIPIEIWSTAMDQKRPYLDVVDATRLLSKTVLNAIYPREIVNAVTCNATVRDVTDAISDTGIDLSLRLVDSPLMNSTSFTTSVAKAEGLGFEFNGDLSLAVAETMQLLGLLGGLDPAHLRSQALRLI
jgi:UDP-glucose 4-epimerase